MTPDTPATASPVISPRTLKRMAFGLLALGILWRVVRYLLGFPIWGDEAMLAINFAMFDCAQLTTRLENCQVAPILFLWGERTVYGLLGPGEYSMRLLPLLAGMLSLALYWRLTGLLLEPRARLFAVGFLAVAVWPVSMSTLVKPYSFDLMASLALLLPAAYWLKNPGRNGGLVALVVVAPLATLSSYPAAFAGGAVSMALARDAWRQGWRARGWFAAFNVALLLGFALAYTVGKYQLATSTNGTATEQGMATYWDAAFPPSGLFPALGWVFMQTIGQMAAYPVGSANGGSALTVLLAVLGVRRWLLRGDWRFVVLLGSPILLNLIAAMLHRYPYGASCRLAQHLAPGICIFAGLGLASLVERAAWPAFRQRQLTWGVVGLFALVGVIGIARDVVQPYRDPGTEWMRTTMQAIRREVPPSDPVVMLTPQPVMESVFVWYWLNESRPLTWACELPPASEASGRVWLFIQGPWPEGCHEHLADKLRRQDQSWRLVKRIPYAHASKGRRDPPQHCELFCFERPTGRAAAE